MVSAVILVLEHLELLQPDNPGAMGYYPSPLKSSDFFRAFFMVK